MTFIQENLTTYTVSQLCSALKFSRSTYYKALVWVPSNRQIDHEAFSKQVKEVFDESKGRYGAVKIFRSLNDRGISCSLKRVQRHMAAQGLRSVVVKKYNHLLFPRRLHYHVNFDHSYLNSLCLSLLIFTLVRYLYLNYIIITIIVQQ